MLCVCECTYVYCVCKYMFYPRDWGTDLYWKSASEGMVDWVSLATPSIGCRGEQREIKGGGGTESY